MITQLEFFFFFKEIKPFVVVNLANLLPVGCMRWVSTQGYFTGQSQPVRKKGACKAGWSLIKETGKQGLLYTTLTHTNSLLSLCSNPRTLSLSLCPPLSQTHPITQTQNTHTHIHAYTHWKWQLLPHLRGFWEIGRSFIPRLCFFFF